MPELPPESIPLIALDSSRARGDRSRSRISDTKPERDDFGDGDDDGPEPPAVLRSEKVVVSTMPPVLTPVERAWPRWYLEMASRPATVLKVVLCAIFSHRVLVEMSKRNILGAHPFLGPIIITTLMVLATMWLHFRQLDYSYQALHMRYGPKAKRASIVVCLLAPILVLPIFETTYVEREPTELGSRTYVTLSSWLPVVPNMRGCLPAWMEARVKMPWNPWAVTEEGAQDRMPDSISFPLPNDGRGRFEELWNGKKTERHGVYMPVLATVGSDLHPVEGLIFDRQTHTTTQMLAVRLVCQFANISEPFLENTGSQSSRRNNTLSVHLLDDNSCHARVQLEGHHLEAAHRASIQEAFSGDLDAVGGMGEFIRYLDRLTRIDAPVTMYTPAWSRLSEANASANTTVCQNRLGVVGLSQAFHQDGIVPPQALFQAATCRPEFQVANISLTFHGSPVSPLNGGNDPLHGGGYLGALVPESKDDALQKGGFLGGLLPGIDSLIWESLEDSQSEQLREEMLVDAAEFRAHGWRWLWPVINEGLGDFIHDRPQHVGSLLFADRLVRESFVAKLATAAELTLRERLHNPGPDVQVRVGKMEASSRAVRQVFQDRIAFHFLTWLAFAVLLVVTLTANDYRVSGKVFNEDYAAWPLVSPAARAMLLRHSSVRPWLRTLRKGIYFLPRMHIGKWYVHEKVGVSGWRLDTTKLHPSEHPNQANPAEEEDTEESSEMDDELEGDGLATAILHVLLILATVFVVGYLTLQGAGIGLSYGRSGAFDVTMERSRRLGVADFEAEVWFWSVLLWHMLPTSLIFFCMIFWLPSLYRFLCYRQPWAALIHKTQPAHKSITLDYAVRRLPLVYAVRNKHWLIAALVIGNLFVVMVPLIQSHVLRPARIREQPSEPLFMPVSNLRWAETQGSGVSDPSLFDAALLGLFKNRTATKDTSHWSWSDASTIPLNLTDEDLGSYRYVQYESVILLAGVECQEVHVEAVAESRVLDANTDLEAKGLSVLLSNNDGMWPTAKIPMPCSIAAAAGSGAQTGPTGRHAICLRWTLHENNSLNPRGSPRWILSVLNGTSAWSAPRHELQFVQRPSALGLACRSEVRKQPAKVTLSVDSQIRRTTSPFTYEPLGGSSPFDQRVVVAIDRGLNSSVAALADPEGDSDVVAPGSLAKSAHFSGDLLSWLLYEQAMAFFPNLLNATSLQRGASRVYAAYLAALVDQANAASILVEPVANPEAIALQRLRFESKAIVGWSATAIQLVFVAFCVGMTYAAFRARQYYTLPLSPEPLLNSLILLNEGTIVSWLEEKFENPEMLSLQSIYQRLDRSGLRFMLEPRVTASSIILALNIVSGSEGESEPQEQYTDSISENQEDTSLRRRGNCVPQDGA